MPDESAKTYDVKCPHCRKGFKAEAIGAARLQGFKCPHCKLFVPLGHADEQVGEPAPSGSG